MDYKKAGVDIEAGYKSVELMKKHVTGDHAAGGSGRILADFPEPFPWRRFKDMEEPVLLSGTDGVRNQGEAGLHHG